MFLTVIGVSYHLYLYLYHLSNNKVVINYKLDVRSIFPSLSLYFATKILTSYKKERQTGMVRCLILLYDKNIRGKLMKESRICNEGIQILLINDNI